MSKTSRWIASPPQIEILTAANFIQSIAAVDATAAVQALVQISRRHRMGEEQGPRRLAELLSVRYGMPRLPDILDEALAAAEI